MATLEDIIAAAAKVFQTKGYHAATVQDIADAVGILKGSLDRPASEKLVYLHEREEMKRRFREQFKLSPKHYERCWQPILREGVKSGEFPRRPRRAGRLLRSARHAELALQVVRPTRAARRARGRRPAHESGLSRPRRAGADSSLGSPAALTARQLRTFRTAAR
jgi:AcrR family transcriptional regulator